MSKLVFASTISEIQQSDVFMTVKARICEAPEANLNGARVTEAFIDDIVNNEAKYVSLPLYADVKALTNGSYNRLGHLYDVKTGEFHSTQIGSFYKFEKQILQNGCALVGYARIPKRNKKLSKAISELFSDNALKFSFELSVGEYEELDDDTILIDASENNYLEGTAIVTYPACEDAVALQLVAQQNTDESRKGEKEMAEVETKAEVVETEATQPTLAEEEEKKVSEEEETDETAACKKKKAEEENAEVVTREYHEERHTTVAFDTETGKEVSQTVTVETMSNNVQEGTLVETVDGVHVAENVVAEGEGDGGAGGESGGETGGETNGEGGTTPSNETPAQETPSQESESGGSGDSGSGSDQSGAGDAEEVAPVLNNVEDKKKTAEQMIAELLEVVEGLKSEIAELKTQKQIAETKSVVGEINPFVDDLKITGQYSLLEKVPNTTQYSLLEKA